MVYLKSILLMMGTLLLVGCQTLWPEYLRPQLQLPEQYVETSVQSNSRQPNIGEKIQNDWWVLYQDQTLNDLVNKALSNNTDIKIAVARIEEADAVAREVGAYLFPQVDLDMSGNRSRVTEVGANPVFFDNPRSNYRSQLGTSFEIDFWGKLRNSKEAARSQALASRYSKDTVVLSLSSLVVHHYLMLCSVDAQIRISQESLKTRDASLLLTKRRLEGGVASGLDVLQAEVASANMTAQLAELQRLRNLSVQQLGVLTGSLDLNLDKTHFHALPIPPVPPAGLPSSLLESRPDIRQAEALMIAANAKISVAKAALYPSITLTSSLGGESLELGDVLKSAARIWTGGLNLHMPIFDSGKLNAKVDQVTAQQKQALAAYERALQNAFKEVNEALINLRQNTVREEALNRSATAAMKAVELSENRYKSGYSGYIEVLDTQRVYNEATSLLTQSHQERLLATVALFKALGGGWQDVGVKSARN